jgi:hypothetical protein
VTRRSRVDLPRRAELIHNRGETRRPEVLLHRHQHRAVLPSVRAA